MSDELQVSPCGDDFFIGRLWRRRATDFLFLRELVFERDSRISVSPDGWGPLRRSQARASSPFRGAKKMKSCAAIPILPKAGDFNLAAHVRGGGPRQRWRSPHAA